MRKAINYAAQASHVYKLDGWRQASYHLRQIKHCFRKTQLKSRPLTQDSTQTEQQKERQEPLNTTKKKAVGSYLSICQACYLKVENTLKQLRELPEEMSLTCLIQRIEEYQQHAQRQIDQIRRRILQGEKIPHQDKVFSLFEPHTEWIVKGKAGVPVELGVRVCIVEDHDQFILNHKVMSKQTDDQVAVPIIRETKQRFPNMSSCSFDKGFHSPDNQKELNELLDSVALPRKGKLSQKAKDIESSEAFIQAKNTHSAVESAINALEVHGLDVCPDHGVQGFERYIALAVLARNVQRVGAVLQRQDKERQYRKKRKLARQEAYMPLAKTG